MHDTALVAVQQALEHLPDDRASLRNRHGLTTLVQILLHVQVEKLEDQVELVVASHDVEQVDDGRVVELTEQGDLADGRAWDTLIRVFDLDFLQRYSLVELEVDRLVDDTVGALADLLEQLEALAARLLLPIELLLGLGGLLGLFAGLDAVADFRVSVTLHGGVLPTINDAGGGLANQTHVSIEFDL